MKLLVCLMLIVFSSVNAGALDSAQAPTINARMESIDAKKLEAKAISIVRKKNGMTLKEAQALFRVDGKTDVARCVEYIITDAIFNMSPYLRVDEVQVTLAH